MFLSARKPKSLNRMRIVKTIYGNLREDQPYLGTGNARIKYFIVTF
jgi:hypothetical protein